MATMAMMSVIMFGVMVQGKPNDYVYGLCNTQNYEPNSSFALNVNTAIGTLVGKSKQSLSGYDNVVPKKEPNSSFVYSMYQCRGDASLAQCSSCVAQIVGTPPCGLAIGTRIQYKACYLRYENAPFSTTQDFTLITLNCSTPSNITLSSSYQSDLKSALRLAAGAAPRSHLLFNSSRVGSAYAITQCLPYLSPSACRKCLSQVSDHSSFCPKSTSGYVYFVTCFYLFGNMPLSL